MHFNIHEVFYLPNSHQHVSAATTSGLMLLLQEYEGTNVVRYNHIGL